MISTGQALPVGAANLSRPGASRFFFVAMASVVVVTVFAGFAPSFFLRNLFNPGRELSVLLHVHGAAFSAWIITFLVQTILIARGSRVWHQRLGWFAAGIAAAMVVLVAAATVEQFRRVPPTPPPHLALALNLFDIIVFAILLSSAIHWRKRSEWHKRLMLSATIILLGAPLFRLLIHFAGDPTPKLLLMDILILDLFFLPCFAYDLLTRRRIHPAYFYALALIVADQITTLSVLSWKPWIDFSNALQRFVA